MDFISASQITSYLLCPMKYRFRYIDGIPPAWKSSALAFGSAVHTALEWFHSELLAGNNPPAEEAARIFMADWTAAQEGVIRFKKAVEKETLPVMGQKLISLYIEHVGQMNIMAVEYPFEVGIIDPATGEVSDLKLRGYFDLLLEGHEIREIKTSATAYSQMKVDQLLQLDAYAYAYRELKDTDPSITVIDLVKTKTPKVIQLQAHRPAERDLWFCKLAHDVARGVDHEVFPANPGWMCLDCEYKQMCAEQGREMSECVGVSPF